MSHHTHTPMAVCTAHELVDLLQQALRDAQTEEPSLTELDEFLGDVFTGYEHLHDASEFGAFPFENTVQVDDYPQGAPELNIHPLGIQSIFGKSGMSHYYAFLGYVDGGIALYYVLYKGTDDKLHGYTPVHGNAINPFSDQIYYMDRDADDRIARKVGFPDFRTLDDQLDDPKVLDILYDHGAMMQEMLRNLSL